MSKQFKAVPFSAIAKRDRDRVEYSAAKLNKHQKDRERRVIMVAVSGNREGQK